MTHFESYVKVLFITLLFCVTPAVVSAATLSVSPSTGVYTTGSLYTVKVVVNTSGKPINAAEGTLTFNPKEITVVSVDRSSSIFNLWVAEPSFSNSAGTVSFSGGLPSGYTGSSGTVFSVTFKSVGSGPAKVNFSGGAVLANDGQGTNVLSSLNGGTYTIQAASKQPQAEEIEYVAPVNTPAAPKILSKSHPVPTDWYANKEASLTWSLPSGVVSVRTALDSKPSTIPTKVYESPISDITLSELPEGISYFHLQFKNEDGWGKVAHYRLAVDSRAPADLSVALAPDNDLSSPEQRLVVTNSDKDTDAPIGSYIVKLNNDDPKTYSADQVKDGIITLSGLTPGYYAVLVEAVDMAGNSSVASVTFTVESFTKPQFTEYPSEINEEVIPVIKGSTRPGATVAVSLTKVGSEPVNYEVVADAQGVFLFIPEGSLSTGVYNVTAVATDEYGARSEPSDPIRIAVKVPGYVQLGQQIVSVLSIIVTLVALVLLLLALAWLLLLYTRRFRKKVYIESGEVHAIVLREFAQLEQRALDLTDLLAAQKRTKKLSETEERVIRQYIQELNESKLRIEKEVVDVEVLVKK